MLLVHSQIGSLAKGSLLCLVQAQEIKLDFWQQCETTKHMWFKFKVFNVTAFYAQLAMGFLAMLIIRG